MTGAGLCLQGAVIDGELRSLWLTDRIAAGPLPEATSVDLEGLTVWPGLINAHDHLELNHFPRSKFSPFYANAHQWGQALDRRLNQEPYRTGQMYALADRILIGGLKNLLCGALTVVHHNPLYPDLTRPDYPVAVLRRYGWAHSLHFTQDVVGSYRKVAHDVPWIIHLAEGVDQAAALEYGRLKKMGCVQPNTVLVHGVGLTADDMLDCARRVRGLVWCPSSNRFLLGYTANVALWQDLGGRVALGSDSRLTADGDLLDEMQAALETGDASPEQIMAMVTTEPAAMFEMTDAGSLAPGMRADFVATRGDQLVGVKRADLALIVRGGVPQIGDPDIMARFPDVPVVPARLDGRPKAIYRALAERILKCPLQEPGLWVEGQPPPRGPGMARRVWHVTGGPRWVRAVRRWRKEAG
ncbi:MAG: amidohydrolase family protein [Anaerolineae bacterium]